MVKTQRLNYDIRHPAYKCEQHFSLPGGAIYNFPANTRTLQYNDHSAQYLYVKYRILSSSRPSTKKSFDKRYYLQPFYLRMIHPTYSCLSIISAARKT